MDTIQQRLISALNEVLGNEELRPTTMRNAALARDLIELDDLLSINPDSAMASWCLNDWPAAREHVVMTLRTHGIQPSLEEGSWWVLIERERHPDVAVGPFTNEDLADEALSGNGPHGSLVDGLCDEDVLEAFSAPAQEVDTMRHEFVIVKEA